MTEIASRYIPHEVKTLRQEVRLQKASRMTGLKTSFPIKPAIQNSVPIVIFGSGASVLDFDFSSDLPNNAISIAINNAVFLSAEFDFLSFELARMPSAQVAQARLFNEYLQQSETQILCRLPIDLRDLMSYPSSILDNPSKSHLFTSVDAKPPIVFERQLAHYLSSKVPYSSPGLDPGFSLGRIIIRLLKLGYKDIRLVGVDLFTPEHYWQVSSSYDQLGLLTTDSTSAEVHPTARKNRTWPATLFLETMDGMQTKFGFSLKSHYKSGSSNLLASWKP